MTLTPKREVAVQSDGSVIVYVTPPAFLALPRVSVHLTADQYTRYVGWRLHRGTIQELLFDLSVDDREKLLSGMDGSTFDRLYPDSEE